MENQSHFLGTFASVALAALLTLTLFDSNPWWKVLLLAIPLTLLSLYLGGLGLKNSWPRLLTACVQGLLVSLFSYVVSLTGLLRLTFGTLVGFALLLTLLQYILARLFLPQPAT